MKPEIHPQYKEVKVTCSCGNVFTTRSTMERSDYHLEVCSQCHPFYTGTQKIVDTAGRVDRFRQKYGNRSGSKAAIAQVAEPAKQPEIKKEEPNAAEKPEAKKAEPKKEAKKADKKADAKKEDK